MLVEVSFKRRLDTLVQGHIAAVRLVKSLPCRYVDFIVGGITARDEGFDTGKNRIDIRVSADGGVQPEQKARQRFEVTGGEIVHYLAAGTRSETETARPSVLSLGT